MESRKIRLDSSGNQRTKCRVHRRRGQTLLQHVRKCHFTTCERGGEFQVFLTPGRVFGDGQIVTFQTPAPDESRILARYQNQSRAPAVRKNSRSLIDSVGVISELALERGAFTDGCVNQ